MAELVLGDVVRSPDETDAEQTQQEELREDDQSLEEREPAVSTEQERVEPVEVNDIGNSPLEEGFDRHERPRRVDMLDIDTPVAEGACE
jgi:hypothetical protein